MNEEQSIKKTILDVTLKFLRQGNIDKISIRKIAKEAGVAIGNINYHFQTKDNLIKMAVNILVKEEIDTRTIPEDIEKMQPVDILRHYVKATAGFLVKNPLIAKNSILNDLIHGGETTNSEQTATAYLPLLEKVFNRNNPKEHYILLEQLLGTLQVIFLRSNQLQKYSGLDIYNDAQRDELIDQLIDNLVGKGTV
ncbi:MAG: TetR/AcrR family transcriptional regulator [Clostridia bacterium]|nr:TetR/AcrR family transcriptional regulator [Clostridia bacterium]